jgi:hypothetical protein
LCPSNCPTVLRSARKELFASRLAGDFGLISPTFPSARPWSLNDEKYLFEHVFFRVLKSKAPDFTPFTNSLVGLTDALLSEFVAEVPREWNNESLPKIKEHLCAMREHAAEFAESLRRFLV